MPRMMRPVIVMTLMEAKMNSASPYAAAHHATAVSADRSNFTKQNCTQRTGAEEVDDDDNSETHGDPCCRVDRLVPKQCFVSV